MHARVTRLRGHGDRVDAAQQFWEHEVLPALRLQPGFCKLLVVADRATGKSFTITLWATEEDEQTSLRSDYMRELVSRSESYLLEPPVSESYEVLVSSSK